jgi:hypothetical protein
VSCRLLPTGFLRRKGDDNFSEPRIATERIPKSQQLQLAITKIWVGAFGRVFACPTRTGCSSVCSISNLVRVFDCVM